MPFLYVRSLPVTPAQYRYARSHVKAFLIPAITGMLWFLSQTCILSEGNLEEIYG
jgi:hypothetical protein